MNPTLMLADSTELVPLVAIAFGCTIAIVGMIVSGVKTTRKRRQREESRREIAAYVAEGSMSVETAERLMAAGESPKNKTGDSCW